MLAETKPDPKIFESQYRDPIKKKKIVPVYSSTNLGEHHLFQLLGYNPQAIKTTAILWKGSENFTLVGLYQMIVTQQ